MTFNSADFVALQQQYMADGREHWGIVLSTEEPINVLMRRLLRLLNSVSAEDLKNQIRWLNEFRKHLPSFKGLGVLPGYLNNLFSEDSRSL